MGREREKERGNLAFVCALRFDLISMQAYVRESRVCLQMIISNALD